MRTTPYSLAYLTVPTLTAPQAVATAAQAGYAFAGIRLLPSVAGGPVQELLGRPDLLRETQAVMRDTGTGVYDVEVVRLGADFDVQAWQPLLDAGAALQARAVLVMAEDSDEARLGQSLARLCEAAQGCGLTANLEFVPWTPVRDARTAARVLRAAGSPANAGILVDALHATRSGTTPADVAALPREHLHYAQICDGKAGTGFTVEQMIHFARRERLLPGEGEIDLAALFAALPADLPVSVEIPNEQRLAELGALEWARRTLAASRAAFGSTA